MTQPASAMRPIKQALPDPAHHISRIMCRCGARDGWGKLENPWDDDCWVCVHCGGPSYMAEEKRMGLAYFRGGPLDGRAYEISQLTREPALGPYIIQYNWTAEVVTSESTGATARVWTFKEMPEEGQRQAEAATRLPPQQPVPAASAVDEKEDEGMAKTATASVSTEGLRGRREALSASRTDIEKLSGLTVPMIARIEKGGPSTVQEEADKYAQALDHIEKNGLPEGSRPRSAKPRGGKKAGDGSTGTEGGDTKGASAPPPPDTSTRLHEWNGFTFTPRKPGDMTGGSPVKWTQSPSQSFTFVAFTRNNEGHEVVELWETRRRRIRYAKPADVAAPRTRASRKAS